jgi:L-fuconolactonase
MSPLKIDTHQHFWNVNKVEYRWLTPKAGVIYRTYHPRDLEPLLKAAGIDKTVLVQSANNTEDTISMLTQAEDYDWIGAVIGWVPLNDPAETRKLLQRYRGHPKFKGMRHLVHNESDPDWILQDSVIEGLKVLAEFDMVFDFVPVYPTHLQHTPYLCEHVPNLTIVIDHMAKPPIRQKQMGEWARQMQDAARYPNVIAKVSGLNTSADFETWMPADLKPYIDFAVDTFGADRCMFGSDWPVLTLAGTYAQVWDATLQGLQGRTQKEIDAILGGTAQRVYKID